MTRACDDTVALMLLPKKPRSIYKHCCFDWEIIVDVVVVVAVATVDVVFVQVQRIEQCSRGAVAPGTHKLNQNLLYKKKKKLVDIHLGTSMED